MPSTRSPRNQLALVTVFLAIIASTTVTTTLAFVPSSQTGCTIRHSSCPSSIRDVTVLQLANKKGFGETQAQPKVQKKTKKRPITATTTTPPPSAARKEYDDEQDTTATAADFKPVPKDNVKPDVSQGKLALERMRRAKAEQRNEELQKLKQVQEVDQLLRQQPEAAVIPEKVAQRMGKRMLPFVGVPLFGSMASFVGFWYMATYRDMEFQPVLVATTSLVLLAVGIVGITYSIMSASWDNDREGSLLGTEEFAQNVENIKTGLSRSRENAMLRDKIDIGMYSQDEVDQVTSTQDNKAKKEVSFSDKMGNEMDG